MFGLVTIAHEHRHLRGDVAHPARHRGRHRVPRSDGGGGAGLAPTTRLRRRRAGLRRRAAAGRSRVRRQPDRRAVRVGVGGDVGRLHPARQAGGRHRRRSRFAGGRDVAGCGGPRARHPHPAGRSSTRRFSPIREPGCSVSASACCPPRSRTRWTNSSSSRSAARSSRCCWRSCRSTATLIGVVVLRQIPTILEIAGIALVVVALLLCARGSTDAQPRDSSVAAHATRRWHPGGVGLLIVRLVELLIVIVPLIGVLYGGFKAVSKVRERADDAPAVRGAAGRERTNTVGAVAGDRADGEGARPHGHPLARLRNRRQQAARLSADDRHARSAHPAVPPRQAAGRPAASRRRQATCSTTATPPASTSTLWRST